MKDSSVQPFLVTPGPDGAWQTLDWRQTQDAVLSHVRLAEAARGRRVGLVMQPGAEAFVWLLTMRELGATCVLIAADATEERVQSVAKLLDLEFLVSDTGILALRDLSPAPCPVESRIIIVTSGTTGTPKMVVHTWTSLTRPVRVTNGLSGSRWLLTFAPHLYAGLQVFLHAWCNRATLVMLPQRPSPDVVVDALLTHHIGYVSATPSFWRYVLLSTTRELHSRCKLVQITLGGEMTDQALLDRLKIAFPSARIAHIYATTELGRCFSVADGREGFPAAYLKGTTEEGLELRTDEGELLVRSANRMEGYASTGDGMTEHDGWIRTGDLVEIVGDRVLFRGRISDLANVGGHKVSPLAVEEFLRTLPEVEDALVYITPSSIAGQVLGCDLVLRSGVEPTEGRLNVTRQCHSSLAAPMRPRLWKVVDAIPMLPGGKRVRRRERVVTV